MPPELSRGFVRALDFGTKFTRLRDGRGEERVRTIEMPDLAWQASKGLFTQRRIEEFAGFIGARSGGFYAFRFWDPTDFSTNGTNQQGVPSRLDQFIAYGDGVTDEFPLVRTYRSTPNDKAERLRADDRMLPIVGEVDDRLARKMGLAAGTVFEPEFAVNGVLIPTVDRHVNLRTRKVRFASPPTAGHAITWGGYYDWPVRLGQDADANFEQIMESWEAGNVPNIPLVLVPFERMTPETDDPGGVQSIAWISGTPTINKAQGKVVELTPGATGLGVFLQEWTDLNYGGPHLIVMNRSASFACDILDEITGATITTLAATPSATSGIMCFVRGVGASRTWFVTQFYV